MYYVNRTIRSEKEAAEFVRICDRNFEHRLYQLVHSIVCDSTPEVITLSGPTCSGKTTAARMLTAEIEAAGRKAMVLSIDDFFRDRSTLQGVDGTIDYDSVAAIDLEHIAACTDSMLRGNNTVLPRYDFHTGTRSDFYEYVCVPEDIIVFEGIQAVYPEVTELLREYPYKSIFINVSDDITVNGVEFSRTDVRLARRLVRDARFRSSDPDFTLELWENVRANEEKNIFPYEGNSDYHINSLQPYELFMIGQYALPLLETVTKNSPHYETAQTLAEKFRCIEDSRIDPIHLSAGSLYHEFLG